MRVFIENEAGSSKKNIFDEKTLEYKRTVTVSRSYPFPYGFVIDTTSGDGDNLDCFVLTHQKLKSGVIVDVEPVGMFEQIEDGKDDSKILACFVSDPMTADAGIEDVLRDFIANVFSHLPNKVIKVGRFLQKADAEALISKCQDR